MKTTYLAVALWASTSWLLSAQSASLSSDSDAAAYSARVSKANYVVTERGANHRVWEWTEYETTPDGKQLPHVHRYSELATGMHYKNAQGEWEESSDQIEILPQGGAAATHGQHQVYFPSDIYSEVIDWSLALFK